MTRLSLSHLLVSAALAVALMITACGLLQPQRGRTQDSRIGADVVPTDVRFVPAPDGSEFDNPTWPAAGDEVVVTIVTTPRPAYDKLYAVRMLGGGSRPISLPDDPQCRYTSPQFPKALPDGRIAFVENCWVSLSPERQLPEQDKSLQAFDLRTGVTARLLPYWLPVTANFFDFAPDMGRGVMNDGRGLSERLVWLHPDRYEVIPLPLARAGRPVWSPDGHVIAIDGAPSDLGREGVALADLPRKLYLMDPETTTLTVLVDGLSREAIPAWSPDSRWLAARLDFQEQGALWLIEAASGRRRRVLLDHPVARVAWSPDGRTLAATPPRQVRIEQSGPNGLYFIELPELDGSDGA
jgi:hypothetical protein